MSNVVVTRFPQETVDALNAVAQERKRTRAEIVREAVDVYLARWADHAIALDRLGDPTATVVDAEPASASAWPSITASANACRVYAKPTQRSRFGATVPGTAGSSMRSTTPSCGPSW